MIALLTLAGIGLYLAARNGGLQSFAQDVKAASALAGALVRLGFGLFVLYMPVHFIVKWW